MAKGRSIQVNILGDARGIKTALGEASGAVDRFGSGMGRAGARLGRDLDSLGGRITRFVRRGALALLATGLAGIGVAIVKGFGRLQAIDDAEGKLRGLGHSAEAIENIMGSALDAVRGTAFGLGDAATIAAGAVASGIKPGEELTRTLSLTADAAAIAGSELSEMGDIFGKVAATNRVSMKEVNSLAQRGVPILQWLAEQYGVTAEEASKMVSSGQVDFEAFQTAIETNIGGAALESGNTFRGALANMGAAAGRFGAILIGPFFRKAKDVFVGLTGLIDDLAGRVGPFMDDFADRLDDWIPIAEARIRAFVSGMVDAFRGLFTAFRTGDLSGADGLVGAFERIGQAARAVFDFMSEHRDTIARVFAAAAPAAAGVAALATSVHLVRAAFMMLMRSTPIGLLFLLATALMYAWQNSETFRNVVTTAFETVQRVVGPIIETIRGLIDGLFSGGGTGSGFVDGLVGAFSSVVGWVRDHWPEIQAVVSTVIGAVVDAWEWAQDVAARVWPYISDFISDTIDFLRVEIGKWVEWFQDSWDDIAETARVVWERIRGHVERGVAIIQGLWERFGDRIISVVTSAWNSVQRIISAGMEVIRGIIELVMAVLRGDWSAAWSAIQTIFSGVWNGILAYLNHLWTIIREVFGAILEGAWDAMTALAGWFAELPGRILEWITSLPGLLWDAGSAMLTGFVNGIEAVAPAVTAWFTGLPGRILSWLGSLLGLLAGKGRELLQGLFNGIQAIAPTVTGWFASLPGNVVSWVGSVIGTLTQKGRDFLTGIITGLGEKVDDVTTWFRELPGNVVDWIGNVLSTLKDKGRDLLQGFLDGIISFAANLILWFAQLPGNIRDWVGDGLQILVQFGKDLVQGAINGVVSMAGSFAGAVRDTMVNTAMGALGRGWLWGSPSRVTIGLGQDIVEGLIIGLVAGAKDLEEVVQKTLVAPAEVGAAAAVSASRTVSQAVSSALGAAQTGIRQWRDGVEADAESVGEIVATLGDRIKGFAGEMVASFQSATSLLGAFGNETVVTGEQITEFFQEQIEAARDWSKNLRELAESGLDAGLIEQLAQAGPAAAPLIRGMLEAVADGGVEAINQAQADLNQILGHTIDQVSKALTPAWTEGQALGEAIAEGLQAGIAGRSEAIARQVRQIVGGLVGVVRDELGIASPSKVMKEIAHDMWAGMRVGLAEGARPTWDDLEGMVAQMPAAFGGQPAAAAPARQAPVGGRVTVNMPAGSRPDDVVKALRRYEQRNGVRE